MQDVIPLVLLVIVGYLTVRTRHALPLVLAIGALLLRSYLA